NMLGLRGVYELVLLEGTDRVRDRSEVADDAVQILIVETEGRHADAEPRPDRDRAADERVQPIGLYAGAFRRQHRRTERRILDELEGVAGPARDDVAGGGVLPGSRRS